VPASFTIGLAELSGASCQILQNRATCTAASLAAGYTGTLMLTLQTAVVGVHTGTVTVSSTDDTYAGNDSINLNFEISPNTDTALVLPHPPPRITVDEIFELQYELRQNRYAGNDRELSVAWWGMPLDLVSYDSANGICTAGISLTCRFPTLAANSTSNVTARFRTRARTRIAIDAYVGSPAEPNFDNNGVSFSAYADRQGDAAVAPATQTYAAVRGQDYSTPPVRIVATRTIDEAIVDIEITNPSVAALKAARLTNTSYCWNESLQRAVCSLGTLLAGESAEILLDMTPTLSGTASATFTLRSPNDIDQTNNIGSIVFTVTDPVVALPSPAPAPNPTPSATNPPASSGGGGGGIHLPFLLALLTIMLWRRRLASPVC
jgi:hypothetical protein